MIAVSTVEPDPHDVEGTLLERLHRQDGTSGDTVIPAAIALEASRVAGRRSARRATQFRSWLGRLQKLPDTSHLPLETLSRLYQEYSDAFSKEVKLMKSGNRDGAARISNGPMKKNFEQMRGMLQKMSNEAIVSRHRKMNQINDSGRLAFVVTALLSVLSVIFGLLASVVVTNHISSSIKKLSAATVQIRRRQL